MTLHTYLPQDRLRALARGEILPDRTTGSALFGDIVAEKGMSLLLIPKEIYMRYWYVLYSPMKLKTLLEEEAG